MLVKRNASLLPYNTFGIEASASYLVEVHTEKDLIAVLSDSFYGQLPVLLIGGGSNILFTKNFDGLIIVMCMLGQKIEHIANDQVLVTAGAGEPWPELVDWCVENNWGGLENLSLIPGKAGAGPIQNIGAYGSELKDVFSHLYALDLSTLEIKKFDKDECRFGYRDSIFKNELKQKFAILSVSFILNTKPTLNLSYSGLKDEVLSVTNSPSIQDVAEVVKKIRRRKLPDPLETGNAGSFFKNPVVGIEQLQHIKMQYQDIVWYPIDESYCKLSAAWMIESCGLKGYQHGHAGVHRNQPLVLVNHGNASGAEILELSGIVKRHVYHKFHVLLEEEINIY